MKSEFFVNFAELIFADSKMFKFHGTNFRDQVMICIFHGTHGKGQKRENLRYILY